jgi:hypothetical protein
MREFGTTGVATDPRGMPTMIVMRIGGSVVHHPARRRAGDRAHAGTERAADNRSSERASRGTLIDVVANTLRLPTGKQEWRKH